MLEIYNEVITDLLNPSATNLQIREDIKRGCYVEDLSEQLIQNGDYCLLSLLFTWTCFAQAANQGLQISNPMAVHLLHVLNCSCDATNRKLGTVAR
jgi:hypothetical protein